MQRAYDYRSDFGERAELVVYKFLEKNKWDPDAIRVAVAFLVPEQTKLVDAAGHITWVNPNIYLYMWKVAEGSARGTEVCAEISPVYVHSLAKQDC
jgi:hypothetical protein